MQNFRNKIQKNFNGSMSGAMTRTVTIALTATLVLVVTFTQDSVLSVFVQNINAEADNSSSTNVSNLFCTNAGVESKVLLDTVKKVANIEKLGAAQKFAEKLIDERVSCLNEFKNDIGKSQIAQADQGKLIAYIDNLIQELTEKGKSVASTKSLAEIKTITTDILVSKSIFKYEVPQLNFRIKLAKLQATLNRLEQMHSDGRIKLPEDNLLRLVDNINAAKTNISAAEEKLKLYTLAESKKSKKNFEEANSYLDKVKISIQNLHDILKDF